MSLIKYEYKCNSWKEMKFICENSDFPICEFVCYGINIRINHFNNKIIQEIDYNTNENIESIISDLPENINCLIINIAKTTETTKLEKIFTNLPLSLNKIKFVYKQSKLSEIKTMESNGKFNFLFGIKIPFNCRVKINYENVYYNVKYNDCVDEIELDIKENIKIKYIPLIIKYVFTSAYVPLQFWFTQNPGNIIPLVALQYAEAKIDIDF